jgi:putative ABC transport system substrate-binding protein
VASLAHPGGNITGISWLGPEVSGKQVELLHESVPSLTRLAVLWHPQIPDLLTNYQGVEKAAQTLGLELLSAQAGNPLAVKPSLATTVYRNPDGLLVLNAAAYVMPPANRDILDFTKQHKLPAMFPGRGWVANGGLMAYAPQVGSLYAHAAVYVDKILRGAQPGDLPVEQPTNFDFVINAGTAASLGLTIPPPVAAQVTEWIR